MLENNFPPVLRTSRNTGDKKTENPNAFLDWTIDAYLDVSRYPNFQGIVIKATTPNREGGVGSGQADYSSRISFQEKVDNTVYNTCLEYKFIMFQDDNYPPEQEVSEQLTYLKQELESKLTDALVEKSSKLIIITKKPYERKSKNSVSGNDSILEGWRKKIPKKIPADFFRIQDPLR